jgi:branched-chain amino acid transport system ATP-binding protein
VLEAVNVTVRFGGLVALDDVSFEVPQGAIVGLVGPNGAGKSTMFDVLSGFRKPDAGQVILAGNDVTSTSARERARLGMSRSFQHPELFLSLTVREHVLLAHRIRHEPSRQWIDFLTGRGFRRANRDETAHVERILAVLHLEDVAERPVAGLPLGTSRLVEVGRAIAMDPKVLLLDEPASGLDTEEREELAELLTDHVERGGASILLVEHDIDMVLRLSRNVYVLDFGVNIASGSPSEIRDNPEVQVAYLGDLQSQSRDA